MSAPMPASRPPRPEPALMRLASMKEGESASMPQTLQHRFRIFLHLLKVRDALTPGLNTQEWTSALVAEALEASARQDLDDWLGYEMALFRAAALVLSALEEHHHRMDVHQAPPVGVRWPDLDTDQKRAFQNLQEGLIRAFLQQEGAEDPGNPAAAS